MSSIVKNNNNDFNDVEQFFDEGVFYPRLDGRHEEVKKSKKEALNIIQEAEEQAIAHMEKFKQVGVQDGLKAVEPLRAQLSSLIEELRAYKENAAAELEPMLTDLIVRAVKKVIKDELTTNTDSIKKTVLHSLATIVDKEEVVLIIHPDDLAVMEKYQNKVLASFRDIKKMTIESSETITRGGCYIKTIRGDVDATIETQFKKVATVFNQNVLFDGE